MNMYDKKILLEGLDYLDLEKHIDPKVSVDEYSAKMGKDCDIITLAFIVKGEAAGNDLVDWFERGYDFVLDAQLSDGELQPGKFLVFVELPRRTTAPERIIELLDDLETLTGMSLDEWDVVVDGEPYSADMDELKAAIVLSPHEYRVSEEQETELNEMRTIAGLSVSPIHTGDQQTRIDSEMRALKTIAGL